MKNQYFGRRTTAAALLSIAVLATGIIGGNSVSAIETNTSTVVAAKDSDIKLESPTLNSGGSSILDTFVNDVTPTEDRRAIMSFDLTSLTSNPYFISIISATLKLGVPTVDANPPFDGQHNVQRLLRDFNEGQVTWNEYSSGNSWGTPGGLGVGDSVSIATFIEAGEVSPPVQWANGGLDVTALTIAWLASPDTTQLGFLMYHPAVNGVARTVYESTAIVNGPGAGPVLEITASFIPEPTSVALFAVGGVVLAIRRRVR